MASHAKFRKIFIPAFIGEGSSPSEADEDMINVMREVVQAYDRGHRVGDNLKFKILYEDDPGSGPGVIRPANLNIYERGHDDGEDD